MLLLQIGVFFIFFISMILSFVVIKNKTSFVFYMSDTNSCHFFFLFPAMCCSQFFAVSFCNIISPLDWAVTPPVKILTGPSQPLLAQTLISAPLRTTKDINTHTVSQRCPIVIRVFEFTPQRFGSSNSGQRVLFSWRPCRSFRRGTKVE